MEESGAGLMPRATSSSSSSPQHLLVTLLGDYWQGRPEHLPSTALVRLLAEFGVSGTSARAALSRLGRRGVLEQARAGRHTLYRLTTSARDTVEGSEQRINQFGAGVRPWDGEWTVAAFSLPEERRDIRHLLRSKLRWLGLAPLFDGVWVSPHAAPHEVLGVLEELAVHHASVVRGRESGGRPMVDAWDLQALRGTYEQFCADTRPLLARARRGQVLTTEALVARTRLMDAWRRFPALDPDLPAALLPPDWPRASAGALFAELYDLLGPLAELRVRQVVAASDPELARLVHVHSAGPTRRSAAALP
jgi:phenylacetic acid degradation operon negative regulatory protein